MEENQEVAETKPTSSNPWIFIGGIIFALIIAAVVFLSRNSTQKEATTQVSPTLEAEQNEVEESAVEGTNTFEEQEETSVTASEPKVVTIEAGSYYYNPKEIRVKKGDIVQIVMTSKDMMHDFTIDELNVKLPITKSGETNSATFVASKVGEFEYYCSVGQHRQMGQTGTLFVEE